MRPMTPVLLATGLALGLLGCETQNQQASPETKAASGGEFTLVTLKVPNMV